MGITTIPHLASIKTNGFGYKLARKEVTFAATVPGQQNLFTVTGDVAVRVLGIVTTTLTGALAVLAVGAGGPETNIIGGYTLGTDMVAREVWYDAIPDSEVVGFDALIAKIITDGNDIILYYKTANVATGVIMFNCFWTPISADGLVVAA